MAEEISHRLALVFCISICFAVLACKRKIEIIPPDAKQISRVDSKETGEGDADVKLREYRFTVSDASKTQQNFVCESREFPDAATAMKAAKKSIAERPTEELKSERAQFALSGRSLWLRLDQNLLWCMFAGSPSADTALAIEPIKKLFISRFQEAR